MGIFDGVDSHPDQPTGDNRAAEDVWTIDMHLRLEALTLANEGAIEYGVSAENVMARADLYVDYIKNGTNNG